MNDIPSYFIYGETPRPLDVGFLHVELISQRQNIHNGRAQAHKHDHMGQITFWIKGGGTYLIEDKALDFFAPTVSFVPSNVVHGFDVGEDSDAFVISISDDLIATLAPQVELALAAPVFLNGAADPRIWERLRQVIDMVAEEYRAESLGSGRLISGLIGVCLSLMARLGGAQGVEKAPPMVALATALRRAVDQHFRENWRVSRYVRHLTTTPHLLDRAAREMFGCPVKEMIMERRLLEAKRLLLFTIRPVEDIGREIGFEDPAYFSRFFRKRMGTSPAAWRNRQLMVDAGT